MRNVTFVSKGLHRAKHTKIAVDIDDKVMHEYSRKKVQQYTDISYQNLLEFIAYNFPGYSIGHLKSIDYGEKGFTDGVHNVIQYIQLNKVASDDVNAVNNSYDSLVDWEDIPDAYLPF